MNLSCKDKINDFRNWIHNDPTKIIRYVVLLICCIVVIVQLTECFLKLSFPPITTFSHYDLNDTMSLPAVTFCREPPYKAEVLKKYNLASHPRFTNYWRQFPFDTANLTEMYSESTYSIDEIVVQYGLSGKREFIDVTSSLHFTYGLCHTFRAVRPTKSSRKEHGYTIILKHNLTKDEAVEFDMAAGWHIFIHEAKENFTELRMKSSGRVEYMYIDVEEEVEIKLQAQHFDMLTETERVCSNKMNYSSAKCGELCIWRDLTDKFECSGGPWMPDIDRPTCNNYTSMYKLIADYMVIHDDEVEPSCNCPDPCQSTIYSAFVMNRKTFLQPRPSTQFWFYYPSKLIAIIQEKPGYDLSQFVADIGGSIGFLLGLSVLGLIGILEKIASLVLLKVIKKGKETEAKESNSTPRSSYPDGSSDITVAISTITQRNLTKESKY